MRLVAAAAHLLIPWRPTPIVPAAVEAELVKLLALVAELRRRQP